MRSGGTRGSLVALASVVLLSGCGVAHIRVNVPEVELSLRGSHRETQVGLVCTDFYAGPEGFTAIVTKTVSQADRRYDWKRLSVGPARSKTSCRAESRYIGFPIILVPLSPSSETARSRELFLVAEGERFIYRVLVSGNASSVHLTSLDDAERRLPAQLSEPDPSPSSNAWRERINLRSDYYHSTQWRPSDRISVSHIATDGDGTILSLEMEFGHDS